ncbi:hypothetical protein MtrunA17_Chr2g0276721 [Medicago truncatula]|uniref:Uncharacterized protein n=1 Tax=Medicago truncatula TaxID=3880 RepID=Q1SKS0_MEDTR|nr:hypothetical protein MtrDRAFT_AC140551g55v2 [Medicago truncatula]RHN71425.1 hypothetical protein MtrunA17_Chr2g0276721 [Medicago truncatula]
MSKKAIFNHNPFILFASQTRWMGIRTVSLNSTPPEFFVVSHKQSEVLIKGKWRSKLEILNKRKEPYF